MIKPTQKDYVVIGCSAAITLLSLFLLYFSIDFHFLINPDTATYSFQKYEVIYESFKNGRFPFINRFEGGGIPMFLAGSLDPIAFLGLRWLNPGNYLVLSGFVYVTLSVVSQYLLLRNLNFTQSASLVGSFLWGFNAFNLYYAHEQMFAIFLVCLPMALVAINKIIQQSEKALLWVMVLIFLTGFELLTGRWALIQYSFLIYLLWAVILSEGIRTRLKLLMLLFVVGVTAFLLTSFFSVPYLLETIAGTYRSTESVYPRHPHWLRLLVEQFYPGSTPDGSSYFTPLVVIPFAVIALSDRTRVRLFCIVLALFFLLFAHDFKLFQLIQQLPFQSGNRVAVRFVIFYYLALSIMVASGYDKLFASWGSQSILKEYFSKVAGVTLAFSIPIAVAMGFFILLSGIEQDIAGEILQTFPLRNSVAGPIDTLFLISLLAFVLTLLLAKLLPNIFKLSIVVGLVFANYGAVIIIVALPISGEIQLNWIHVLSFLICLGLFLLVRCKQDSISKPLFSVLLILYIVGFSTTYNLIAQNPSMKDLIAATYTSEADTFSTLNKLSEKPFRIWRGSDMLQRVHFPRYQIEDINYFTPLPNRNLISFFRELVQLKAGVSVRVQKAHFSNFLRLANVRYYFLKNNENDPVVDRMLRNGFVEVPVNSNYLVLEDTKVFDRFRMVSHFEVIPGDGDAIQFLKQKADDLNYFRKTVVLNYPATVGHSGDKNSKYKIQIKDYGSGHYRLETVSDRGGILIIADRFDKNWQFKVDGKYLDPLKANFFFIGLPLDPGDHIIEAEYSPASGAYWLPISCFLVACLFLLAIFKSYFHFKIKKNEILHEG
jgi:hypothetical protein